jgi:hypothetical protein
MLISSRDGRPPTCCIWISVLPSLIWCCQYVMLRGAHASLSWVLEISRAISSNLRLLACKNSTTWHRFNFSDVALFCLDNLQKLYPLCWDGVYGIARLNLVEGEFHLLFITLRSMIVLLTLGSDFISFCDWIIDLYCVSPVVSKIASAINSYSGSEQALEPVGTHRTVRNQ